MQASDLQQLRESALSQGWQVKTYSADEDIRWLWELDLAPSEASSGADETNQRPLSLHGWVQDATKAKNLLIIWDGMPKLDIRPVVLSDHLTPLDWALSFSRRALFDAVDSAQSPPALRIFIADCYSQHLPDAHSCLMVDSLLAALPWLWVIRPSPLVNTERSLADKYSLEWLQTILNGDNSDLATIQTANSNHVRQIVGTLVHGWLSNLGHSASHHDVNNILGPLVLLDSLNRKSIYQDLGRRTLLQHARWLGLAPVTNVSGSECLDDASEPWFDAGKLAKELGQTVRFILVDDQANKGWKEIVAAALGVFPSEGVPLIEAPDDKIALIAQRGDVELWASTSVDLVTKRIKEVIQDCGKNGGYIDKRFQLRFTDWNEDTNNTAPLEVLLLDLRLVRDQDDEAIYFDSVLELVEQLTKHYAVGQWPWKPICKIKLEDQADSRKTLENLRIWVNEYKITFEVADFLRDATYLTMLSLLARVIATLDLSLPIILFSSSGQRGVTEECKGYGNIVTAFEKPRFLGYQPDDMFREAKAKWSAAMEQAAELLRGRSAVTSICNECAPIAKHVEQAKYVEIFLDESGEPGQHGFTVAGLVLIYPTRQVAEAVDEKMRQTKVDIDGRQTTLCWTGHSDCLPKRFDGNSSHQIMLLDKIIFPAIAKIYKDLDITVIPFGLRAWKGADVALDINLLSEQQLDNLYLHTAKEVLDAVLYELIPWSSDKPDEIKIFAATRLRTKKNGFSSADKKRLFERFALLVEQFGTETAFRSVRPESFAPIVADVLRNRPNVQNPNVTAVVGVPINLKSDGNAETTLDTVLAQAKQLPWYATSYAPLSVERGGASDRMLLAIVEVEHGRDKRRLTGNRVYESFRNSLFGYAEDILHLRQSHFIADLLANTAFKARRDSDSRWYIAKHHFGTGMLDDLGESGFEFAIDASKCLEAHDRAGALLRATVAMKAYRNWRGKFPDYHEESIVPRVLTKVGKCLGDLSGEEFAVYCRSLRDWVDELGPQPKRLPKRTGKARKYIQTGRVNSDISQAQLWASLPRSPWNNRMLPTDAAGHGLTVAGFARDVTPEIAENLVRAYLVQCNMWTDQTRVECGLSKSNKPICKLFNISKESLAQLIKRHNA